MLNLIHVLDILTSMLGYDIRCFFTSALYYDIYTLFQTTSNTVYNHNGPCHITDGSTITLFQFQYNILKQHLVCTANKTEY